MFNKSMNKFLKGISNSTKMRNEINKSMVLFIYDYPTEKYANDDIFKSLIYRCPCYGQHPNEEWYDECNVNEILGYDVKNFNDVNINIRYGILGLTYKNTGDIPQNTEDLKEEDKKKEEQLQEYRYINKRNNLYSTDIYNIYIKSLEKHTEFWTYHIWGINLEDKLTKDYFLNLKNIHPDGEHKNYKMTPDKEEVFLGIYTKLYNSIYHAAKHIIRNTDKHIGIKMPLIGLDGKFLGTLSNIYKKDIQKKVLDIIYEVFKDYKNDTEGTITLYLSIYGELKEYMENKGKSVYIKFENIFIDSSIPIDHELLLINIWNPHSYIGNGLSRNNTMEEMLVSGRLSGCTLQNSSYFHNPFLSQSLLEPSKWIDLKKSS